MTMDAEKLVEAVARAIYEEDDPWHKAWPWPDLQSDQAGVDQYRRIARAALAVALPWLREVISEEIIYGSIGLRHADTNVRARFDALAKEVQANG